MASDTINWSELAAEFQQRLGDGLRLLAKILKVKQRGPRALGVGWSEQDKAWTFPERDAQGNVIGILRRYQDGRKKLMSGGSRGLYLPHGWSKGDGPVFVPEGASDVAALVSHGIRAVGRPSCTGGTKLLHQLFSATNTKVIIVGENDQKDGGRWPGRDGAEVVARELLKLGIDAAWTLPPKGFKDVREYLICEGSQHDHE